MNFYRYFFLIITCLFPTMLHAALDFGTLKATPYMIESITLKDKSSVPVMQGATAQLIAKTYPENLSVTWSVEAESPAAVPPVDATITSTGLLTAESNSGNGWVRVTASLTGGASKAVRVQIGCFQCTGSSCNITPGSAFIEIGSINARLSLGKAEEGMAAGDIVLFSKEPTVDLATPSALEVHTLSENIEEVYRDGALRQIITPQAIVDIIPFGRTVYEVIFYNKSVGGSIENGLFKPDPSAAPFTLWRIESSDPAKSIKNNLSLTELKDGKETTYQYSYDANLKIWSLLSGNGLKRELREERVDVDGNRTIRITLDSGDDHPVSITEKVFHEFPWGDRLVKVVEDPAGLNIQSSITYQEAEGPGYSHILSRTNSDGSWERYVYDEQDRIISTVRPWLDSAGDSPQERSRVIVNDYTPLSGDSKEERDRQRPRVVTEYVQEILVSRDFYLYGIDSDGARREVHEQCVRPDCSFGDSDNLRTVTLYYPENDQRASSGKIKSILRLDKQLTRYEYETGTFIPHSDPEKAVFNPGEGLAVRTIIIHGTEKHPDGIPFRTTIERSVRDWLGNQVLHEQFVTIENGAKAQIGWTYYSYNALGQLVETLHSNATRSKQSWSCCGKSSSTSIDGITTTFDYDDLKRLSSRYNEATGQVTEYQYDASGRQTAVLEMNDSFSRSQQTDYDLIGRPLRMKDTSGLITTYHYDDTVTTIIRPGGAQEITRNFTDGRIHSITGSGVVSRYYQYGVNPDGSQWTLVHVGSKQSPRWEKTTRDILGRVIEAETPGFAGSQVTTTRYNALGQVVSTTQTGIVPQLYEYDELGYQVRSGLDTNSNGRLDADGIDRIQETNSRFIQQNGSWWQENTAVLYTKDNSAASTVVSRNKVRLSGWQDRMVSETVTTDIHGNETVVQETLDRYTRQRSRTTHYPDSGINAVQTFKNNQLISSISKSGIETRYSYDAFSRRIGVTDPRKGTSFTNYNDKGQINSVVDAAGGTTRYLYDPETGARIAQINAQNKATYYQYNLQGQLTHTWGDAVYPVSYDFNKYGEMEAMHTYRQDFDWQGKTWPQVAAEGDITTWLYHEGSGLLLGKTDAQNNSVRYAYDSGGKLSSRTWARGVTTKYNYNQTGELATIDYSDATPDISFNYDRLGRKVEVTDGQGIHKFTYNDTLQLVNEGTGGEQATTFTRNYDAFGRNVGFTFNDNYSVTYSYDESGRFKTVGWDINGSNNIVTYNYQEHSNLLTGLTTDTDKSVTYGYEPHRDLRTSIINKNTESIISRYEYQYDRLGRRTNVINDGIAFTRPAYNLYGYNDRNELQDSTRFAGEDLTNQTQQFHNQDRFYQYDPIGNRIFSKEGESKQEYATTQLNQYEKLVSDRPQELGYDPDGNLTEIKKDTAYTQYTYNGENRLIAVEPVTPQSGDLKSVFAYDYMGRRTLKRVLTYQDNGYKVQNQLAFVYDGWNLIAEYDLSNNHQTSYVWGLDISQTLQGAGGIGGLLARIDDSGTLQAYFYDGNGNVGQLVDVNSNSIAAHYEYDPYGKPLVTTGPLAEVNPFQFSSKYLDQESGLYYYGYRFYAPELGRWINRDPIEEDGGLNLYGFVGNNGVNLVDINGLEWVSTGPEWYQFQYQYSPEELEGIRNQIEGSGLGSNHNASSGSLIDSALEAVLETAFYRCYLLDLSDEELQEINSSIEHDLSLIDTSYVQNVLHNTPKTAAMKFLALNAAIRKITASIPQGSTGILGIPTPQSVTAQQLNKNRALLKVRREIRDYSIKMVGKGGVKVWGRLGSKVLPVVGWFSLGYEAVKACHCINVTKDGSFSNNEKMLGQ